MGKKLLLSEDYFKIVLKCFLKPKTDWIKYYTNVKVKHLAQNPDLFTALKDKVNEYIEWYKGQVIGGSVPVEMPDGSVKCFDRNQTWESDGDGDYTKWVKHDLLEHRIFLLHPTAEKNVRVNKSFFEDHLRILEEIEMKEKLRKLEVELNILNRIDISLKGRLLKLDKSSNTGINPPEQLHEVFTSISKYNYIMSLLVEKKFCQSGTFIWSDAKGNLVALIKYLRLQGYYKHDIKLTANQIVKIAKNTFGINIGYDTANKIKHNDQIFKFIPIASTIDQ